MIELTPFIRQLRRRMAALTPGPNRFAIRTGTVPVHFRVHFVPGATGMLVSFHGATCRARREAPIFNAFNPDLTALHQVSVSDPSMQLPGDFRIAWFAGHEGFDTPGLFARVFRDMARTLGVERTLFFGTSGGGFAALVQSHAMPGSVAVVVNPQTSILRYHPTLVEPYRQACWPALAGNEDLAGAIEADCTRLYGEGFRNTVIYIQSLGDRHHYRAHMLPFAAAISARAQADRVLFHTRYNGVHGHSQSREDYADWLRAAALSPSTAPLDLLDTWHGLQAPARTRNAQAQNAQAQSPQPHPAPASFPRSDDTRPADIQTSARLETWLERQSAPTPARKAA